MFIQQAKSQAGGAGRECPLSKTATVRHRIVQAMQTAEYATRHIELSFVVISLSVLFTNQFELPMDGPVIG